MNWLNELLRNFKWFISDKPFYSYNEQRSYEAQAEQLAHERDRKFRNSIYL